jgi:hypothetical protein
VQRLSTALFYVFVNMLPPDTIFNILGLAHVEAKEGVHGVVCNNSIYAPSPLRDNVALALWMNPANLLDY